LLGIVQGLTEFIPVSSSGHLILVSEFLNLENSSLTFDVALHGGTLIALFVVFWRDLIKLIKALFIKAPETQLAWLIIVATIPAAIVGFLLEDTAQGSFRSSKLVAVNLIIVAILMLLVERYAKNKKLEGNINKIQNKQGIFVGFAQALAVVPGVSRSGVTITAGLFAGIDRVVATRFSFLLGIPIIFGAVLKVLMANSESSVDSNNLVCWSSYCVSKRPFGYQILAQIFSKVINLISSPTTASLSAFSYCLSLYSFFLQVHQSGTLYG